MKTIKLILWNCQCHFSLLSSICTNCAVACTPLTLPFPPRVNKCRGAQIKSDHFYWSTTRWDGGGIWEGSFGCEVFTWVYVCWGNRLWEMWVRWVLRGTGIASGHPGVSWKISPRMRWLSQPVICSKMGQPEFCISRGDEFDVIRIEEAVCWQAVGQVIDVDDKQYRAYDRSLGDTTYGLSHLG